MGGKSDINEQKAPLRVETGVGQAPACEQRVLGVPGRARRERKGRDTGNATRLTALFILSPLQVQYSEAH